MPESSKRIAPRYWFESVGSTMPLAAKLAREGAPHGTVVGADEQTAGVGRHGQAWHSEKGSGLYVSIVLRPPRVLPAVTLALGLAAREAIEKVTSLVADLRWPNDVLIRERKCAGVLAQFEGDAVIAGIGVNLAQTAFPPGLATPATSLKLEGANVAREHMLDALLDSVDHYCEVLAEEGVPAILRLFEASSSYARGRRVRVDQMTGVTAGLDESGFLILRQDNGAETILFAGGVRPA